ncbi:MULTISPECIES: hypothetical protein [unclassified Thalassospira]|nr:MULTISPECIES: hypothetical protein [unclassified Thalassospira]
MMRFSLVAVISVVAVAFNQHTTPSECAEIMVVLCRFGSTAQKKRAI